MRRGWTPQKPSPEDLFDACSGDGPRALWAMLRYLHAEKQAEERRAAAPPRGCFVCAGGVPAHLVGSVFLHDTGCPLASAAAA